MVTRIQKSAQVRPERKVFAGSASGASKARSVHNELPQRQATKTSGRTKRRSEADQALQGIKVVDLKTGLVVTSVNASQLFNPASNTKLATTLAVGQKFGWDYRFQTRVSTSGALNNQGELEGDLFVSGCYMLFGDDQATELAGILNARGITSVKGDLVISPRFSMNLHLTGADAGAKLLADLDPGHGQAATLLMQRQRGRRSSSTTPSKLQVSILGQVKIAQSPEDAVVIATHNSPHLRDIVKIMLCYSDNTMAQYFGDMIGGADALTKFVIEKVGVSPQEVNFATTSGLGVNRVSPRALMKILTALMADLSRHQLNLSDLLAVTGIDDGTMKDRLNEPGEAGSVIAKTGTLTETDQGVSALSGWISTKGSTYLFVIFDMHGDVEGFRRSQDAFVEQFQKDHGGAKPIAYVSILPGIDHADFWQ